MKVCGGQGLGDIKLTMIIPVFNTEKYLRQCLDSIVSQTMQDIEIYCIDDGSTDGSGRILDEYARRYPVIHLIHKQNGGLVSVRKLGVARASGEYIGFLDSDDWIEPDMYERLYHAAKENDADMVSSNYIQEGAYSSISRDAVEPGLYDDDSIGFLREHAILDLKKHDKGMSGSLCTKLFRASLLKKIMPEIPTGVRVSEDKITTITALLECSRAFILDEAFYHYRINQGSMFHADDPEYLLNCHTVYSYFRGLYSHRNFTDMMRRQAELYIIQFLIKGINTQMGFSFRNIMWIEPSWIKEPGLGERIALCGGGDLGKTYETHIKHCEDKVFAGYVDPEAEISETGFDSVVITVKNRKTADEMKNKMIEHGVPSCRIFWFEQEEIFWRYADAMGLLDGE